MTFNEMVAVLQDHLGIPDAEQTVIEQAVNAGKDRYVKVAKWPHLESSEAQAFSTDTRVYSAPALCESIVGIEDASGNRVVKQERDTWDTLFRPDTSTATTPSNYAEQGTDPNTIHQFQVWPTPAALSTGVIRYMVRVPSLTSTTGTYDHIPESHHFAIVKAAETEFFQRQGQNSKSALAEQQFNVIVQQLAGDLAMPVLDDGSEK